MFCFIGTDIKEQKKYGKRMQISVDNTVNDLCYESSLKIMWKTKITFLLSGIFLFFYQTKITHMWRRWGTPQNFFLAFIDEFEKQIIKKTIEVGQ